MRVFRVQRDCGQGPFQGEGQRVLEYALGRPSHYQAMPCPWEDGILNGGGRPCGCATIRDVIRWFPKRARQALHDRAYKLFEFEVPDQHVLKGGVQVVFDPTQAEVVASYPLAA
ncbi:MULTISPECIES: hypothetical protein [unclassified Sphingomonas]|uniref:hypothetical protein n=1 Tax=unclassified Sphingomonas TaxID=196159 RepID=UPI002151BB9A|nr:MULTISPECIES: hypothetical protein [unclassified Sphingomonas]MCR5870660.1 hypothetical protein [Sphingomonas sp. J344]UUY01002.1 hypothetical protein LRS08_08085 [Sphingomonas sp. J315]